MNLRLDEYKNRHGVANKFLRFVWGIAWVLFCRWTPRGMCYGWRAMWCRLFGAKIGNGCHIYPAVRIWAPWNLEMGDVSCLGDGVNCYNVDKVVLGKNVSISPNVFICTASHDVNSVRMELTSLPIAIKDNAWVASYAIVLPGVTIAEGGVVAAGAVVTKNVDPWVVVGGNPAKPIKRRILKEVM